MRLIWAWVWGYSMHTAVYQAYIQGRETIEALAESDMLLNTLLITLVWERDAVWPLPVRPQTRQAYETAIIIKGLLVLQVSDLTRTVLDAFVWTSEHDAVLIDLLPVILSPGYKLLCQLLGNHWDRPPFIHALIGSSLATCQATIASAGLSADQQAALRLALPAYLNRALTWHQTGKSVDDQGLYQWLTGGQDADSTDMMATALCGSDAQIRDLLAASYQSGDRVHAFVRRLLVSRACPWFSDYSDSLANQITVGLCIQAQSGEAIETLLPLLTPVDRADRAMITAAMAVLAETGSLEQREYAWRLHKALVS